MTAVEEPEEAEEASDDSVLLSVDADGVAVFTLNRPDRRNGWNPDMERRYYELLRRADTDPAVRVGVLTGAGTTFCPGVDASRLSAIAGRGIDLTGRQPPSRVWEFRKPLIAAINGACAGMGLVQALMCDVRFAATGARFATSFARRGLAGEYGVTWLLPRYIGVERAMDLLLSARTFEADEAERLGLVSRVVPVEEVLAAAVAYARDIARHCAPTSTALIKHQVRADLELDYDEAMRRAYRAMAFGTASPDFREGMDSFLARRPPAFAPLPDDLDPATIVAEADPRSDSSGDRPTPG